MKSGHCLNEVGVGMRREPVEVGLGRGNQSIHYLIPCPWPIPSEGNKECYENLIIAIAHSYALPTFEI